LASSLEEDHHAKTQRSQRKILHFAIFASLREILLYRQRIHLPDILSILAHGSVRREEATARRVED
jgi:hypothetical protein